MSLKQIFKKTPGSKGASEDHWIPLSDLMMGMMMVFLLVAVLFMNSLKEEQKKIEDDALNKNKLAQKYAQIAKDAEIQAQKAKEAQEKADRLKKLAEAQANELKQVAVTYNETRQKIYEDLMKEFKDDLPVWNAVIDPQDLSVRFQEPDVLFDNGRSELKGKFKDILNSFFPRYIGILTKEEFKPCVEEIRIEGHTSSSYSGDPSPDVAYIGNMRLSQDRTRATLEYVLKIPQITPNKDWLRFHLTANGLSSSHLRTNPDGSENPDLSRRVEFRIRTNSDDRIKKISTSLTQ